MDDPGSVRHAIEATEPDEIYMRILLVGNYAPDRQQSMLRFAALMQRELAARGYNVTLLQPPPYLVGKLESRSGIGKWLGYIDKFLLFPFLLRRAKKSYDIVHICDHSNAMYAKYLAGTPHLVTCHDVLAIKSALGEVPENIVSSTGRRLQTIILNGLKRAQYIVCVSGASRADMLRVTARPPETSEVIYLSLNYPYAPIPREQALAHLEALSPFFQEPAARTPFFLHVGAHLWYKNRRGVVEIYRLLRQRPGYESLRLLFIGEAPEPELADYIAEKGLSSHVSHLTGVSNEDLCAVYSLAEGLLFPSLQEGFGWPILEAQSCGCPVFATGRPPMTELGGDAAIYFDPLQVDEAAKIISHALESRAAIREVGLVNVQRFTVQKMIDGYVNAYQKVAGGAHTTREGAR
jgi:glycosyltransferase involved in cell wall biosynthesis